MKKIWGILLVGMSVGIATANPVNEWKHIIQVTKQVTTNEEVNEAIKDAISATQKAISVITKEIGSQVSPAEKERIVQLVAISKKMSDSYCAMLKNNNFDNVDEEGMAELRELAQDLMNSMLPIIHLMQDPMFVSEQRSSLYSNYRQLFGFIQQMLTQIQNDLK